MSDVKKISSALEAYGLSQNEAKTYVALLDLLEGSAYQVAEQAGIPRSTAHYALKQLLGKGLIEQFKKGRAQYFTPSSMDELVKRLDRERDAIEPVLDDLRALAGQGRERKPGVLLFLGKEGVKRVYNDMLDTLKATRGKQLHAITQPELFTLLPRFFPEWVKRRKRLGITAQLIMPERKESRLLAERYSTEALGEIRFAPEEYTWNGTINIYANKIALFSFASEDLSVAVVENKTLADMFRTFFTFNWNQLDEKKVK